MIVFLHIAYPFEKLKWKTPFPCLQIAFQVLVKALISLNPGEEMEILKKQFQEFISGLMSLPVKLPGTQLYRSLQASFMFNYNFARPFLFFLMTCVEYFYYPIFRQRREWLRLYTKSSNLKGIQA